MDGHSSLSCSSKLDLLRMDLLAVKLRTFSLSEKWPGEQRDTGTIQTPGGSKTASKRGVVCVFLAYPKEKKGDTREKLACMTRLAVDLARFCAA
jgi:hypothetical protein